MKRVPPVKAQAARLEAHLLRRAGEGGRASERLGYAAELAAGCGLRFDAAVIALERAEWSGRPTTKAPRRPRARRSVS